MSEQEYAASQAEQEDREQAAWEAHIEELGARQFPQYPMWPATRNEIEQERFRQNQQWGGLAHDDTHSHGDWLDFIRKQLDAAESILGEVERGERDDEGGEVRIRLVKIAALAVAAIESATRIDFAENG